MESVMDSLLEACSFSYHGIYSSIVSLSDTSKQHLEQLGRGILIYRLEGLSVFL